MKNWILIVCFSTITTLSCYDMNNKFTFDKNDYIGVFSVYSNILKYEKMLYATQRGLFERHEKLLLEGFPLGHFIEYFLGYMLLKHKIQYMNVFFDGTEEI